MSRGLKDEHTNQERKVRGVDEGEYFVQKEVHIQRQQDLLKE